MQKVSVSAENLIVRYDSNVFSISLKAHGVNNLEYNSPDESFGKFDTDRRVHIFRAL
jgi:hypothetical protein